jgi:hypothetical protein
VIILIELKRGDTFSFFVTLTDEDDNPIILDVNDMLCQIRQFPRRELIDTFTITTTDISGQYRFSVNDTTTYPIDVLYADIEFTIDNEIKSSDTFKINVVEDVSRL